MFFPQFTQPQQFMEMYRKMMADHLGRLEALGEQLDGAESKRVERATEAVDEGAKMLKASIDYSRELSVAWRRQTLEIAKQASSAFMPTL